MSAHQRHKLVMMANQVAVAFDSQRGDAVGQTVDHIKAFWPRRMREDILRHLLAGGEGLTPTAKAAVARLAPTPQA
jgi:formate dehydrogenase subunit delta